MKTLLLQRGQIPEPGVVLAQNVLDGRWPALLDAGNALLARLLPADVSLIAHVGYDIEAISPFLDATHACYPTKAIVVAEFGFDASRHGPVEERGTYEFQANTAAFHLAAFATKPWLSGAIWFAIQDFAAKPGWTGGDPRGTPPYVQKGMFDLQGNVKPGFSVLSAIYHGTTQITPAKDVSSKRHTRRSR